MKTRCISLLIAGVFIMNATARASDALPNDVGDAAPLKNLNLLSENLPQPFSFVYDGQPSTVLLPTWTRKITKKELDATRIENGVTWTDEKSGLEVRCVSVVYSDFPAVEWTVWFKNTSKQNTPMLSDVEGLDTRMERSDGGEFQLNGINGDWCAAESYAPYQLILAPNLVERRSPDAQSGKSCDGKSGWPYYNLQFPGGGMILAIGWPGQWRSLFERDAGKALRIRAGQEHTHLVLKPGEEIRTPLITLLYWKGSDVTLAQNLWRRWYIEHNLPRVNGVPQQPVMQIQTDGAEASIEAVKGFLEAGIKPDVCWRDAGAGGTTWYPNTEGPYTGNDAWLNTGTWEIDATKYPKGFRPFTDWIHAHEMKFVLWFEPERVGNPNSFLGKHTEWLLPGTSHGALLNLGNPSALKWLIDHVDGMIKSQGIDWYREDMNGGGPLPAWRHGEPADREGVAENLFVQGHLAFWDELRRRNPDLHIDSCASGGRRNDLESMRRAVPLLRSDFQIGDMKGVVEGNQGHTYGLSFWLPFQGTGIGLYDAYSYRSFLLPGFGMGGLEPNNKEIQKKAYADCRKLAPLMLYGDYFPLTPYSLQTDQWIAWEFNRPEEGTGYVMAFRRQDAKEVELHLKLRGLDPSATYEMTDSDKPEPSRLTGRELMETGLSVALPAKGSALIFYRRLTAASPKSN